MLEEITPLLITFNEEANVARTLSKISWARNTVVVDSGSTDETLQILARHRNIQVFHRPFTDFASQCNFGLLQIETPWVLSLDADYELTDELIEELQKLTPSDSVAGYEVKFVYSVYGHKLRGSLYPPRIVLYRKGEGRYQNEGHGHRLAIGGVVLPLSSKIIHDDRKPLARWFASQQRYAYLEAEYLEEAKVLNRNDRIRRMAWPGPVIILVYTLFVRGCILDGWPGWFYALQRLLAEALISLELLDRRLRRK